MSTMCNTKHDKLHMLAVQFRKVFEKTIRRTWGGKFWDFLFFDICIDSFDNIFPTKSLIMARRG
jgi:hypothetical protein